VPDELPAPIEGQALIYATADGTVRVEVLFGAETFWLTINRMAELFGTTKQTISYHLRQVYGSGELSRDATVKGIVTVQEEGSRDVSRTLDYYNLDAVISVGYRVNCRQATQFRIWATQTLKEFIVKGFVLDDERLKQAPVSARTTSTSCSSASARSAPASGASTSRSPTSTSRAASTT
jgi:hypothetical protein